MWVSQAINAAGLSKLSDRYGECMRDGVQFSGCR